MIGVLVKIWEMTTSRRGRRRKSKYIARIKVYARKKLKKDERSNIYVVLKQVDEI